ncbi:MAG TPA: glutaredoxin family protein [Propionibacteriaceae bacterium]|nr:glutaredoxin family protein [Propionibacteriaceae bacterium]
MVVLTRAGCHLCELAEREVAAVADSERVSVQFVDLDASEPHVRAAWTDHVPVTVVDGTVVAIWAVDADKVRAALSAGVAHNQVSNNPSMTEPSPVGGDAPRGAEGSGR